MSDTYSEAESILQKISSESKVSEKIVNQKIAISREDTRKRLAFFCVYGAGLLMIMQALMVFILGDKGINEMNAANYIDGIVDKSVSIAAIVVGFYFGGEIKNI